MTTIEAPLAVHATSVSMAGVQTTGTTSGEAVPITGLTIVAETTVAGPNGALIVMSASRAGSRSAEAVVAVVVAAVP